MGWVVPAACGLIIGWICGLFQKNSERVF